ncbi:MAG: transglutaminase-like domain-containing protein [Odoribacteraceae bacterium]|jgi:hypothetical protein|nr:transglutaminase-like domain-containing protein [Odoribacteraceae bacterium]
MKHAIWIGLALAGCQTHFIPDNDYRATVEKDFESRRALFASSPAPLFAIFDAPMTPREREAMQFLYAYSPLVDVATLDGAYFLEQTREAFRAREETPWARAVPDDIFRHFVLPPRGGKETLDSARKVFHDALRERVARCATIEEAALEVNHWCRERVIYHPTNARTMSPLATRQNARGRCGEESIFTLAALRSVGIPARQIYTPRWAHCDDNHAWIEVWTGGVWKYLGACEPEPRLDIAWFSLPVRRAVYVEAEVFGRYEAADEEVVLVDAAGSKVNVTGHYTRARRTVVRVLDDGGRPAAGALVEYKVFNYGEFYTVLAPRADERGECRLTLGEGDLMVWASDGGRYGVGQLSARADSLTVVLDKGEGAVYASLHELRPPAEGTMEALSTDAERGANERRIATEDSLRGAYLATFVSRAEAGRVAAELGVDSARFIPLVAAARGNGRGVIAFARETPVERREVAMDLLEALPEKDLQDTPPAVWRDHLEGAWAHRATPYYKEYILNPRVRDEQLTAYRAAIAARGIGDVEGWREEVARMPRVDSLYRDRVATPPTGVLRAGRLTASSAEIFLVAAARSVGTPARVNPVTGRAEFFVDGGWRGSGDAAEDAARRGKLIVYHDGVVRDPLYFLHFTIAKVEGGVARTIDLGSDAGVDMGAGAPLSAIFAAPLSLEVGDYILAHGNRRADGSVAAGMSAFTVREGETTRLRLPLQPTNDQPEILGKTSPLIPCTVNGQREILAPPPGGYIAVAIVEANAEPTNHLLRDIAALSPELEALGHPIVVLFENAEGVKILASGDFRPFPSTLLAGVDAGGEARRQFDAEGASLPVLLVINGDGDILLRSKGYRVGLGNRLLQAMSR